MLTVEMQLDIYDGLFHRTQLMENVSGHTSWAEGFEPHVLRTYSYVRSEALPVFLHSDKARYLYSQPRAICSNRNETCYVGPRARVYSSFLSTNPSSSSLKGSLSRDVATGSSVKCAGTQELYGT
jgi:hypothetical protein